MKAAGHLIAFDLGFARGNVMRFRVDMHKNLQVRFPEMKICDFGHVGDGGLHFNLVVPKGSVWFTAENVDKLLHFVIEAIAEMYSGRFSAEHGLGRRNQKLYDRYSNPVDRRLSTVFKSVTSPSELGMANLAAPNE